MVVTLIQIIGELFQIIITVQAGIGPMWAVPHVTINKRLQQERVAHPMHLSIQTLVNRSYLMLENNPFV